MHCFFFRAPFVPLISVVSGYNFAQERKKKQSPVFFEKFADQNTKGFLKKRNMYLEGENNERLSRMPKWTQMFCMDLIKEKWLKH